MYRWDRSTDKRKFIYTVKEFLLYLDKTLEQHGFIKEVNPKLIEDKHLELIEKEIIRAIGLTEDSIKDRLNEMEMSVPVKSILLVSVMNLILLIYLVFKS